MFPAPEKVATPGLSAPNSKLAENAQHIASKLQEGEDIADEVMGYCVSGGPVGPPLGNQLLWATLGNRLSDKRGCPKSLLCLLTMKADPNVKHPQLGPALCWAARNGDSEIVQKLIDAGADMEACDPDDSPSLKAAIIAGAAAVAIDLIQKGANVMWKHHDGATYLHIVTSWLCDADAAEMNKRMRPVGDEPHKLICNLIYNGVDPTAKQKWEGKGLSAVDTWRARKDTSPWLHNDEIFEEYREVAMKIHTTLVKTEDALERKVSANKNLKEKKYEDALKGYQSAREILTQAAKYDDQIFQPASGHHMASLWSNEAICCLQMGDRERAHNACQEGLKLFCSDDLKEKLRFNLEKCEKPAVAEPEKELDNAAEAVQTEAAEAAKENRRTREAAKSKLEKGFFDSAKTDLYGPEGSRQGTMPQFYKQPINGGEAVIDVPINQQNCAQMKLIPMPDMTNPDDEDD